MATVTRSSVPTPLTTAAASSSALMLSVNIFQLPAMNFLRISGDLHFLGNAPVDLVLIPLGELRVRLREMPAARERLGGQRRRMRCFEHGVAVGVDQLLLRLRMAAPQEEYRRLLALADEADDRVGELLPPLA